MIQIRREKEINEGRMARLNPYLMQSLKEIVRNADTVLVFVSHGNLRYDTKSAAFLYRGAMFG